MSNPFSLLSVSDEDVAEYDEKMLNKVIKATVHKINKGGFFGFLKCEAFPSNVFFHLNDCVKTDTFSFANLKKNASVYVVVVKEIHAGVEGIYGRCVSQDIKLTTSAFCNYKQPVDHKPAKKEKLVTIHPPIKDTKPKCVGEILTYSANKQKATIVVIGSQKEIVCVPSDLHKSLKFGDLTCGMKVEFEVDNDGYIGNVKKFNVLTREDIWFKEDNKVFFHGEDIHVPNCNVEYGGMQIYSLPNDKQTKLFKHLVEKHVTAFLNNGQGGVLYFGVDCGKVIGTICDIANKDNQMEEIRKAVYNSLQECNPPVSPSLYTVHFYPVYKQEGLQGYVKLEDKWVITVEVKEFHDLELFESTTTHYGRVAYTTVDFRTVTMSSRMAFNKAKEYFMK